jgi:hypothetical protein
MAERELGYQLMDWTALTIEATIGIYMASNGTNTDLANAEILWKTTDALRGQINAAEYKHVVLGLLFLKYISDAFEARRDELKVELEAEGIKGPQLESLLGRSPRPR